MSSLSHIFQKPMVVEPAGDVFPVLIKDYEEFMNKANIIIYNYAHFNLDEISKSFGVPKENIKLLDLIVIASVQSSTTEESFQNLADIFSIVLRKKVEFSFDENILIFYSDDQYLVDRDNYDEIRKAIMEQNLLFEPKVFKNKITQEWAEKVLSVRAKNSINMTLEDMVTTVAAFSGKHYWDLENYTFYQLKAEFSRISKFKSYDTMSHYLGNPYASDISLGHFAENTELLKSPYDDIFVSDEKVSKLNSLLGGK